MVGDCDLDILSSENLKSQIKIGCLCSKIMMQEQNKIGICVMGGTKKTDVSSV